jgi:hypothetical protein
MTAPLRLLVTDPLGDLIERHLIPSAKAHAYLKPGRNDDSDAPYFARLEAAMLREYALGDD